MLKLRHGELTGDLPLATAIVNRAPVWSYESARFDVATAVA